LAKKIYVLDTNVYLTDSNSIESFNNNDIVIPLKVLDEIDKHKKRQDPVGIHARKTIRKLDALRERGNLCAGVRSAKGKGLIFVKSYDSSTLPPDLDLSNPDNQILATALTERENNPGRKVILVSRDINMRVKCDSLGLISEDYNAEQVVDDISGLYTGLTEQLVDDQIIDKIYNNEEVYLTEQGDFARGLEKKPLSEFQDILPRLQGKKKLNTKKPLSDLDVLYQAGTPKEKREMRQRYKEYNFVKRAFKEDLRKQEILKQKIEPIKFSPLPSYYEARKELTQEQPKPQPTQPKPEGIAQVLFSAPPKETGGLDEIIEDAVFRLKNPWINGDTTTLESRKYDTNNQGGNDDQ